ncbi:Nucleolar protein 13 [Cladophialophora chaetospira]|uniref:Nucleolar protein 13 n=1 Tax=Cladophialophora chaetospira TaxID=386627 RepID=A0AA38XDP5_9EURO|nr:Nucleolar protein 13 [Cladophialophora chaetospira]
MSILEMSAEAEKRKGRKRDVEEAELEIDVEAPEPPSKKALRKAKKAKVSTGNGSAAPAKPATDSLTSNNESREPIKRSDHGVWIGNLSFGTTKDDLMKFLTFSNALQEEQITRVHLPQGPPKFGKPQNKGFAYVDFAEAKCVETVLALSESMVAGRRVLIKNAKNFEGRPEQKNGADGKPTHPPSRKIFIGNLDFTTTVEDLEAHFGVCGTITHTHMATFEDSGKCKGYAWLEFEQLSSAETAVRGWVDAEDSIQDSLPKSRRGANRTWVNTIQGRRLKVEFAEDKAVRYEKRYGKSAKKAESKQEQSNDGLGVVDDGDITQSVGGRAKAKKMKPETRYSEATVQKLTGGIVESKGRRMVFE